MNRRLVLLNLTLVALLGLLGWQLRKSWIEARAQEKVDIEKSSPPAAVPLPPPVPSTPAPVPADYIDVAQRTLFSQDRDPNVIIEPPPPPPPPPQRKDPPPLPAYHGQMALGEAPSILLSLEGKGQKSYRAGDQIGDFKIVSFDRDRVAFEWEGETLERSFEQLREEQPAPKAKGAGKQQQAAAPPPPPARETSTKIGSGSKSKDPRGRFVGGKYMCVGDDKSPNGTVYEGFRKTEVVVLMGATCAWEPVE